jgi:hypothetical protein
MPTYYIYIMRLESTGHLSFVAYPEPQPAERVARGAWQVDGAANATEAIAAVLMQAADQWVGSDITITRLVPHEPSSDERLDAARRVLRADYWDDVRSIVDELKGEIKDGSITDRDQATEWLDERIDSAHRVVYTYAAMEAVIFSDNDGAYEDHFGSEGMVEDGQVQWSRLAFYAMQADVMDQVGDIEELLAEAATECDMCGATFKEDEETEIYEGKRSHVECPDEEDEDDGSEATP